MDALRDMEIIRARQLWTARPGRPTLDNGALAVRRGRVAAAGTFAHVRRDFPWPVQDLGEALVVPGLINCHCHLELSHLRGVLAGGSGYAAWVREMLEHNQGGPDRAAMEAAARAMAASGTVFAADISARAPGLAGAAMAAAGLEFWQCLETIGHDRPESGEHWPCARDKAMGDRLAAAGHALYSTSPWALAWARGWSAARGRPFCLHLAESVDEEECLARGTGPLAELLARRLLPPNWEPPGMRPVAYADALGLLGPGTLAVHGVCVSLAEARLLAERGAAVCLCPRSNAMIGVGQAPWSAYGQAGTLLCLGTDSLASNADLDLWNEARFLLEAGAAPLLDILTWMTANAALALKVEKDYGTLEPGRKARYTVVPGDMGRLF